MLEIEGIRLPHMQIKDEVIRFFKTKDDRNTVATMVRDVARSVIGWPSGQRNENKETCWWNKKVQKSIQQKSLVKLTC